MNYDDYIEKKKGKMNIFEIKKILKPIPSAYEINNGTNKVIDIHTKDKELFKLIMYDWTIRTAVRKWLFTPIDAAKEYGHIKDWDVSRVTNMSNLFTNGRFNADISAWDVSKVADMHGMFYGAGTFNQSIGNWNVSNVTNMNCMFKNASYFNRQIGNWDVSKVTDMDAMFYNAQAFNQPIGDWNVSNVTGMIGMFGKAKTFNQPIGNWDVSNVFDMNNMFCDTYAFNQDINTKEVTINENTYTAWDVSMVYNMERMFFNANVFNQPIGNWNVSNVTNMKLMFSRAKAFNQPIGKWDVSNVTIMTMMFNEAHTFNQPLGDWNILYKTIMKGVFAQCGYKHKKPIRHPIPIMSKKFFKKCEKTYCEETKTWEVYCGIGQDILLRKQAVKPPPIKSNVAYHRTSLQKWLKINKTNPVTNTSIDINWIKQNYPYGLNFDYEII